MVKHLLYGVGIVLLLFAVYASQQKNLHMAPEASVAHAAAGDTVELDGYAFSETIGWISFNCKTGGPNADDICGTSDYKVLLHTNDTQAPMLLTGYAWSDAVGWIKFDVGGAAQGAAYAQVPGGRVNCPSNGTGPDCRARIQGNDVIGWIRVCAVFDGGCSGALSSKAGGWDGWVSLSSLNHNSGPVYGVTVGNAKLTDFAWGSDIVGWMDWNPVSFTPPCPSPTRYTCEAGADDIPDAYTAKDQFCHVERTECLLGYTCTPDPVDDSVKPECQLRNPTGTFEVTPARVRKGTEARMSWNVKDISGCTIKNNETGNTVFDFTVDTSTTVSHQTPPGGQSTGVLDYETTFVMECRSIDGLSTFEIGRKKVGLLPALELF